MKQRTGIGDGELEARMMQRGTDCGLMTGKLIVSTGEHFNPHLETSLPCQSGGWVLDHLNKFQDL